jgi:ADP-heptose:LPS heptosyltransferase
MELRYALPLFKLENTQWIVISKNVNENEQKLLSEYNVLFYGNQIDTQMNAFEESVNIIKNVDAVISTDTSLVHISPCLNIKTFVLLTVGYEWRWETSNWYPDSVLIKQTEYGNWKGVIDRLINKLTKI